MARKNTTLTGAEAFRRGYLEGPRAMPKSVFFNPAKRQQWLDDWAAAAQDPEAVAEREATIEANRRRWAE